MRDDEVGEVQRCPRIAFSRSTRAEMAWARVISAAVPSRKAAALRRDCSRTTALLLLRHSRGDDPACPGLHRFGDDQSLAWISPPAGEEDLDG